MLRPCGYAFSGNPGPRLAQGLRDVALRLFPGHSGHMGNGSKGQEELILVAVMVPDKLTLELRHLDPSTIEVGNNTVISLFAFDYGSMLAVSKRPDRAHRAGPLATDARHLLHGTHCASTAAPVSSFRTGRARG